MLDQAIGQVIFPSSLCPEWVRAQSNPRQPKLPDGECAFLSRLRPSRVRDSSDSRPQAAESCGWREMCRWLRG